MNAESNGGPENAIGMIVEYAAVNLPLLLQVSQDKVKALLRLSELERVQVRSLTCCLHIMGTAPLRSGAHAQSACTAPALPLPHGGAGKGVCPAFGACIPSAVSCWCGPW